MKDYAIINPSLIIVENIEAAQNALMTNKFPCPILFIGKSRRDFTVRAEGFDFIENFANKDELIIRANALLRIKAIKDKLERVHNQVAKELTKKELLICCWRSSIRTHRKQNAGKRSWRFCWYSQSFLAHS